MNESEQLQEADRPYRSMTVAHIRDQEGANHAEIMFLESTRFYKLLRENRSYDSILAVLREAMATKQVLKVRFATLVSDVIEGVE